MYQKATTLIAAILLLSACSSKQKSPSIIPIQEKTQGVYLIELEIGKERKKAHFLFDTGSEITALDKNFAQKIGIKVTGKADVAGTSSVESYDQSANNVIFAGNEKIQGVTFTLLPLGEQYTEFGETYRMDGIIGADLIKRFTLSMNFDTSELTLYSNENPVSTEGYVEIPFTHTGDYFPRIEVKATLMNGEELSGKAFFDLGATNTLIFNKPFGDEHEIVKKAPAYVHRPSNDVSGKGYNEVVRLKSLKIAEYEMLALPADVSTATTGVSSYPDYLGMLGSFVINKYNFVIDAQNKKMYLKPNKNYAKEFEFPLTVIFVEDANGKMIVAQDTKTNTEKAEIIQKGSEILSIDGQSFPHAGALMNYIYKKGNYNMEIKDPSGNIKTIEYQTIEMI